MITDSELQHLREQFSFCMPVFIALGDEVRLNIMETLTRASINLRDEAPFSSTQGLNVKEITKMTQLSRPAISHHLKILKDAGLIASRQVGTSNYYYLTLETNTRQIMELCLKLQEFLSLS